MEYEEIFEYIGHFGHYQLVMYMLVGSISIFHGMQATVPNYLGYVQPHWCDIPQLSNFTFEQQRHIGIPYRDGSTEEYDDCKMFALPWQNYTADQLANWNRSEMTSSASTVSCDSGYVYDRSVMDTTIITQWDLVCGRNWLVQFSASTYIAGMLVGSLLAGILGDKFGRLRPTVIFSSLHPIVAVAAAYAPGPEVYCVLRFFVAICAFSAFLGGYVIVAEFIGPRYRVPAGIMFNTLFGIGSMILSIFAFFVRDSVKIQLIICLPASLTVLFWWLLPESPRWWLAQGREEDAIAIFEKVASVNGSILPPDLTFTAANSEGDVQNGTIKDLLKYPGMRKNILICYLIWFTNSLLFYGLGLNLGALVGSIFLNGFLMSCVDTAANMVAIFTSQKFGRRVTCMFALLMGGIANFICIPLLAVEGLDWLLNASTLIGKAGGTIAFAVGYLMTAELFPTQVRQVAVGSSSMCSRIAGVATPYMGAPLSAVWFALPSTLFGTFGMFAGVATYFLPETRGVVMPASVEEAERLFSSRDGKSVPSTLDPSVSYSDLRGAIDSKTQLTKV